jgi:transcriptional regulator with XRE-family HTH domain
MKLHTIIRKLREEKDITQESLGLEIGVDRTTIGRYEKNEAGSANLTIAELQKIAKVFGLQLHELLSYQDKKSILHEPEMPSYTNFTKKRSIVLSIELDGEKDTLNFWLDKLKKVNAAIA